jgi:hypothetical protein
MPMSYKIEKKTLNLQKVQNGTNEFVAGSVWLRLVIDCTGKYKLPIANAPNYMLKHNSAIKHAIGKTLN